MKNDEYMTPKGRTNNLISNDYGISPNPIHLFTNAQILSPPISALKGQCQRRNIPVEIYSNPNDLISLMNRLNQKSLIVIETPRVSATEISWVFPQQFAFPKSSQNVKIISFPSKISSASYDNAKQKNDVLAFYDQLFGGGKQLSKIKLRKVHSSKDIKYELMSPKTVKQNKAGKEIFFQKLLYSDYKVQPDSQFKLLTDSIKNTPNTYACLNLSEVKIAADGLQGKGSKLLLLVDERGLKEWREYLERMKLTDKVQMMVLGDLKPNKQLLKSFVYFASDNGQEILSELEKLKFEQVDRCRTEFIRLTTSQKNQFRFSEQSIKIQPYQSISAASPQQVNLLHQGGNNYNNNNNINNNNLINYNNRLPQRTQFHRMSQQFSASIFSNASSQFQRYMRNWTIDIDPNAKDKRYAEYVMFEEEGKQHIQGPSQPMSKRASRITGRRNSSQTSSEHYSQPANNLVDQYQRLKTRQHTSTVNIPIRANELQLGRLPTSQKEIIATPTKQSSATQIINEPSKPSSSKKIIQITKKSSSNNDNKQPQTKYQQMTTNVIQQTSQQYRGSNRQSIVNIDDHFYHYSQGQVGGSGNNLGGSAANVSSTGNFSKVKNTILQPVEQAGMKKTVHHLQQSYPMPTNNSNQNINIANLGYDSPYKQQLPIQSPSHSQVRLKQRLIDGLTGQLIGTYDLKAELAEAINEKISKKVYQTVTVVPYLTNQPVKNVDPPEGYSARELGYDSKVQYKPPAQAFIIDGRTGELFADSKKRMDSMMISSSQSQTRPVILSSLSSKPQQIIRPSHNIQPQIVKIPFSSSSSINNNNDRGSRQSIATEKKFTNNAGGANINSQHVDSATSITQTFGANNSNNTEINSPRNISYYSNSYNNNNNNTNRTSYNNKPSNSNNKNLIIGGERVSSPSSHNSYNYNSNSTSQPMNGNYTVSSSANYKVYTPEQYTARYQLNNGNNHHNNNHHHNNSSNRVSNVLTSVASSSNNYDNDNKKGYTRDYSNNANNYSSSVTNYYNQQSQKQPEVINRVYIKASDLPQRQISTNSNQYYSSTTTNRRYQASPNQYATQQYKTKLSVEDTDPFNQRTTSKHSSLRKGSYLMRKQDGKRDPYSPYQENGSTLQIGNQKSAVKVYSSDEYQKVVDNRKFTSPRKDSLSNGIDLTKYDRVVENGIAVYKPKNTFVSSSSTSRNVQPIKSMEPNRDNYHQSKVTVVNGYQSGVTRYQPTGRDYANSPTRREGSSYQKALRVENPLRRPSQDTYQTKTLTEIAKNVIPLRDQRVTPLIYDSRSPMKVTEYRTSDNKPQTYTYSSPTRHIYQRRQIQEPRVQASNLFDRVEIKVDNHQLDNNNNHKMIPQNEIGIISGIHKNSEIFQLSDGSIMRRNNIKFGVNKYNKGGKGNNKDDESFQYLGQMKSRIHSKIMNLSELNRQYHTVEKRLLNQQQVVAEKEACSYINTSPNQFYFLIDDQLNHLFTWVSKYVKTKNDKTQLFRGIDQLYEKIHRQKVQRQFDITLVFVKAEDIPKINKRVLPQDTYIVEILGQDFKGLEVSQKEKRITLNKLPYIKLTQKIIIEPLLTHIILYQRATSTNNNTSVSYFNKEVTHLLSLFPEGQFIKQPYDSPLSLQLINDLIDESNFNRLYIICNEKEMTNVVEQLDKVSEEGGIADEICKIICIPQDNQILKHEEKIESYPRVAWMTNSSKINDYKSLIKYALRQDENDNIERKQTPEEKEKIYYHSRHKNICNLIQKEFPSRFESQPFNSLAEVEKKIMKANLQKAKQSTSPKKPKSQQIPTINYLILHPILNEEYIDTKLFKKIFMLGKSDKTQRKVVKVSSNQELMELLKR